MTEQMIVVWTSFNECCFSPGTNAHYPTEISQLKPQVAKDAKELSDLVKQFKNVVIIAAEGKSAEVLWGMPGVGHVMTHLADILRESGHMVVNPHAICQICTEARLFSSTGYSAQCVAMLEHRSKRYRTPGVHVQDARSLLVVECESD